DEWFLDLKSVISARRKLEDKAQLCAQRAQILKAIDRRCDIIQSDQSKWINSALERNNKAIVIDKLIYEQNDERRLLLDPAEIKNLAADTFDKQFRKRATHLDDLSPLWSDIYRPLNLF